MGNKYIIKSPCKINLHLDVHNKREDGYHNLTSIFQLISLEDEIFAEVNNSGQISVDGDFDCKLEDNLIYKAANEYIKQAGLDIGIIFRVKKNIPSGGGIGGGSSNCGAVLRFLFNKYPEKLSESELFKIALSLGSDVPFFLDSGTSLVRGRGEIVTPIKPILNYYIVLVNPSVHISTKTAFSKLTEKGVLTADNSQLANNVVAEYSKGVNNFTKFKNSFEIALHSDYNFIDKIKTALRNAGAIYAALSGSGSTMFGIFTDKAAAEKAECSLKSFKNYKVYLVKPLKDFPDAVIKEV